MGFIDDILRNGSMYPFIKAMYEANMRSFHEDPKCKEREKYYRKDPDVIDLEYDSVSGVYKMEE